MSGSTIGGSAVSSSEGLLVDVVETWNGFHLSGNGPHQQVVDYLSSPQLGTSPNNALMPTLTGAVGSLGFDVNVGRIVQTWPSAAVVGAQSSQVSSMFAIPFSQRNNLAQSVPVNMIPVFRRYQVDYVCRVTAPGTAEMTAGIAFDTAGGIVAGGGNNPACAWSSRSGVDGGKWVPRYRLATAGAIVDGTHSTGDPSAWHKLTMVVSEGLITRIEWWFDDQLVFAISNASGDVGVPNSIGAFACFPVKAMGAPAGTTIQYCETRYRCRVNR